MFRKLCLGLLLVLGGCALSDIEYTEIGVTHVGKSENAPDTKIEIKQQDKAPL